jgi:hypothetical protein
LIGSNSALGRTVSLIYFGFSAILGGINPRLQADNEGPRPPKFPLRLWAGKTVHTHGPSQLLSQSGCNLTTTRESLMRLSLSRPKETTFVISMVIAVLTLLGQIVPLPFFTGYAYGLLLIAYIILALGVYLDNL